MKNLRKQEAANFFDSFENRNNINSRGGNSKFRFRPNHRDVVPGSVSSSWASDSNESHSHGIAAQGRLSSGNRVKESTNTGLTRDISARDTSARNISASVRSEDFSPGHVEKGHIERGDSPITHLITSDTGQGRKAPLPSAIPSQGSSLSDETPFSSQNSKQFSENKIKSKTRITHSAWAYEDNDVFKRNRYNNFKKGLRLRLRSTTAVRPGRKLNLDVELAGHPMTQMKAEAESRVDEIVGSQALNTSLHEPLKPQPLPLKTLEENREIDGALSSISDSSSVESGELACEAPEADVVDYEFQLYRSWKSLIPEMLVSLLIALAAMIVGKLLPFTVFSTTIAVFGYYVAVNLPLLFLPVLYLLSKVLVKKNYYCMELRDGKINYSSGMWSLQRTNFEVEVDTIIFVQVREKIWERFLGIGTLQLGRYSRVNVEVQLLGLSQASLLRSSTKRSCSTNERAQVG